jgi:Flp pilus assembly protein TadG
MSDTAHNPFIENDEGASAVEFAIVLPVFLLIVCGILAYGVYFGATYSVQQLSADAARAAVGGLTNSERKSIADQFIANAGKQYPLLAAAKIVAESGVSDGDPDSFQVSVTYDASDLPILSFAPFVPVPEPTIRRVTVIRRGGF